MFGSDDQTQVYPCTVCLQVRHLAFSLGNWLRWARGLDNWTTLDLNLHMGKQLCREGVNLPATHGPSRHLRLRELGLNGSTSPVNTWLCGLCLESARREMHLNHSAFCAVPAQKI